MHHEAHVENLTWGGTHHLSLVVLVMCQPVNNSLIFFQTYHKRRLLHHHPYQFEQQLNRLDSCLEELKVEIKSFETYQTFQQTVK